MGKISFRFSAVVLLTCLSLSESALNKTEEISKPNYRELFMNTVGGIYKDNFKNFRNVVDFAKSSQNTDFKAVVLGTLYDVMKKANHTQSPLRAIPLYNVIDRLINATDKKLFGLNELKEIRRNLALNTIVPVGADILRAAVYVNSHKYERNTVSELLDLLSESSQAISNDTITRMVDDVYNIEPTEKLVPLLASLSKDVLQNVYAMLALEKKEKFKGTVQLDYFTYLRDLTLNPDYISNVPENLQRSVNEIIPADAKALLSGNVCIYRRYPRENKLFYMLRCSSKDQRACITKNVTTDSDIIVYKPERQSSGAAFRFQNAFTDAYLNIRSYFQEDRNGIAVNFFADSIRDVDRDLLVNFENNGVVFSDVNRTMFICSGNLLDDQKDVFLTQTIAASKYELYKKDCRWNLKAC